MRILAACLMMALGAAAIAQTATPVGTEWRLAGCGNGRGSTAGCPIQSDFARKWNPGHYVLPVGWRQNESNQAARVSGLYQEIVNIENIRGVALRIPYGSLEVDTRGNYAPGFAFLDAELDALAALPKPKRIFLRMDHVINDYASHDLWCSSNPPYYSSTNQNSWAFPRYMSIEGMTVRNTNALGLCTIKWWDSRFADAYIDMLKAYGARYDGHPLVEGIAIIKETALGGNSSNLPGYNEDGFAEQLKRISLAAKEAWPRTNVVVNINAFGNASDSYKTALTQWFVDNGIGLGGPDMAPDCVVYGDIACTAGFLDPQTNSVGKQHQRLRDLDAGAKVPVAYSIESSQLGNNSVGQTNGYLPQVFVDYCEDFAIGCSHLFWGQQVNKNVDTRQQWGTPTGVRTYITSNTELNDQPCPTSAAGGCGEPVVVPGVNLAQTQARFVGAGGTRDAGCGLTPQTRCAEFEDLTTPLPQGTDVWFLSGTVRTSTSGITINWGGSSADQVIIGTFYFDQAAGNRATAYDDGSGAGRGERFAWRPSAKMGNGISIGSVGYVTIQDIVLDGVMPVVGQGTDSQNPARFGRWLVTAGSNNITLQRSSFRHAIGYNCVDVSATTQFKAFMNDFYMCGNLYRVKPDGSVEAGGDIINVWSSSPYAHIENNKFDACGHNCVSAAGNYLVLRHNTIKNSWDSIYGDNAGYRGTQLGVFNGSQAPKGRYLVELNDYADFGIPPARSGASAYSKFQTNEGIVRLNKFSNQGNPMASYGWNLEACCSSQGTITDQRIYNNEVEDNASGWATLRNNYITAATVAGNVFKNNIIGPNLTAGRNTYIYTDLDASKRRVQSDPWDGNTFIDNCFKAATVNVSREEEGVTRALSTEAAAYPAIFIDNQIGSLCTSVDEGADLAVTTNSGTGVTVQVDDARYFSDGNGLIQGDEVSIGSDVRRVVAVDRAARTLTVDQSLTWASGEPVNLACNAAVKHGIHASCGTPGANW